MALSRFSRTPSGAHRQRNWRRSTGRLLAASKGAGIKTYEELRAAWRREETWINHALNALLASMPDDMLSRIHGELCGGIPRSEITRIQFEGATQIASSTRRRAARKAVADTPLASEEAAKARALFFSRH